MTDRVTRSNTRAATGAASAPSAPDDGLNHEMYSLILVHIKPIKDLARCTMISRSFGAPGGIIEQALRLRASKPQPKELPTSFTTWLQKLIWDERREEASMPELSVGRTHGAVVHDGRVHVWGTEYVSWSGRECPGLLGVGIRNHQNIYHGNLRKPKPLADIDSVAGVSCGREHTLLLSDDGTVYAFGNAEWGQCGHALGRARKDFYAEDAEPHWLRGKPTFTNSQSFGKLKEAYLPVDALYKIVDDLPFVWWGTAPDESRQFSGVKLADNYEPNEGGHPYGPFGMMPPAFVVSVPKPIIMERKVLKVSAGDLHSLLLCDDEHAYSFGCAYDGRLGLGTPSSDPPEHVLQPTKIALGALSGGARVVDISAGDGFSLAVRADGTAVSWGRGLLGHGPLRRRARTSETDVPCAIRMPGVRVCHASAGFNHSLLVDTDGAVYSFGCGEGGCLGHGAGESAPSKSAPTNSATGCHSSAWCLRSAPQMSPTSSRRPRLRRSRPCRSASPPPASRTAW